MENSLYFNTSWNEFKLFNLFCSRKEMSSYYLEHASVHHIQKHFDFFEEEARSLLALGLAIPAYVLEPSSLMHYQSFLI